MSLLRTLEKTLDARLRGMFGGRPDSGAGNASDGREGIELYRDALDQIAARGVAGTRGERVFPFDRVTIDLRPGDPERRAVLETLFEPGQLRDDVRTSLREERIAVPAELEVAVRFVDDAAEEMRVLCEKAVARPALPAEAVPVAAFAPVRLVTLTGAASEAEFTLDRAHLNIGREVEVLDAQGRTLRRNELYFPEGAHEANPTVSRSHAHLRFDSGAGEWRIYDDGSSLGTAVFREGRRIEVPAHSVRGVAVRVGDEIYLGSVRVRVEAWR